MGGRNVHIGDWIILRFLSSKMWGRFKASSMNYTVGISDIGYLTKIGEPYCSLLQWNIKAYVPKVDIGKYSKFWIEKKV